VLAAGAVASQAIIVDNGSSDDSLEQFAARFPELPVVRNERNLGFAGGMNAGIRYALEQGAASVLLLNNDTVIAPDMISSLLDSSEALGAPGILGPAIYAYDDPEHLWKLGDRRHGLLPMPLNVRRGTGASPTSPFQVDYVTGCGMLIRREVFDRIGLFDARYFMYFEDADFCRRARDAGFAVWCIPKAKMWHKISLSAQRDKPFNRYHRALGQVRFYREHPHGPLSLLSRAYVASKVVRTTLGDLWRRDWELIGPLWRGTLDGYKKRN
jgi:GT2 family glycosyltransferase